MSGGLIVAVCVVAVLVLAEMLLPRIIRSSVIRRKERARVIRRKERACVISEGVERVEGAEKVERIKRVEKIEGEEKIEGGEGDEREKLWAEARGITPGEMPSFETDLQYVAPLLEAAERGEAEAMSALGDFAFQRGALVEAFYWRLRVEMGAGCCCNPILTNIISAWVGVGCPDGGEEIGASLSEQQAAFAHAVLCLLSGVDPRYGTMRLKELSDAGVEDAKQFLERR